MEQVRAYTAAKLAKRADRLEATLEKAAKAIRRQYRALENAKADCPYAARESYLKRSIYAVLFKSMQSGIHDELHLIVSRRRLPGRKLKHAAREFAWAMFIMFGDEEYDATTMLPPAKRSRYARQMGYALRHRVPPHLLIGFLYQCGSPGRIAKKLADGTNETWLRPGKREQAVVEILDRSGFSELEADAADVAAWEAAKASRW